MIRKFVLAASAVVLVSGSLVAAGGGGASAASTPITAGAGSKLNCGTVKTTVKVSPPVKDDWVKADHQQTTGANAEPNSDVRAINDITYAPPAPSHISVKGSSATCNDSVAKQGAVQSAITKIAVTIVDEASHPTTGPESCINLVDGNLGIGPPSTMRVQVTIKYTAASGAAKVNPTTITDAVIDNGFTVEGGTVTGSFAGSTNLQVALAADATTSNLFGQEIIGPAPDGTTVARSTVNKGKAPNPCQPGVKIKGDPSVPSKPHSATPVPPKGVSKIGIDASGSTATGTV